MSKQIAISDELYSQLYEAKDRMSFNTYIAKIAGAYSTMKPMQRLLLDLKRLHSENQWILTRNGIHNGDEMLDMLVPGEFKKK